MHSSMTFQWRYVKVFGKEKVYILGNLLRKLMEQEKIRSEWKKSVLVASSYLQRKGELQSFKSLSHTMKVWERVVESRLREESSTSGNNSALRGHST